MASPTFERSVCANALFQTGYWTIPINRDRWTVLTAYSKVCQTVSSQQKGAMPTTISPSQPICATTTSLMSVLNNEDGHNAAVTSISSRPTSSRSLHPTHTKDSTSSHTRRGSSATTESAESSPTTTISTVDSTLSDPSPSSSPESPNLQTLKETSAEQTPTARSMDSDRTLSLDLPPKKEQDRSISPNKRPRNAKGLSINTAGISTIGTKNPGTRSGQQSAASLPAGSSSKLLPSVIPNHLNSNDAVRPFSEPSSPAFIVPQFQHSKRSKLGLTITTPDSRGLIGVPQTPLRGMAPLPLRTRASDLSGTLNPVPETPVPLSSMRENDEGRPLFSPSMAPHGGMQLPPFGKFSDPILPTPSFGPEGGMRFPSSGSSESSPYSRVSRPPLSLSRTSFDSPHSSSVVQHTIEHNPSTPLHDLPLSQEAKSPGYPDGPICIYPPSVFLYHQPTREEARKFDVIINVAREVTNPFLEPEEPEEQSEQPKYKDAGVQCMLLVGPGETVPETVPQSAISQTSFSSALENLPDEEEPETPRATSPKPSDPEYIHLPWEHNSKVYEEWLKICEMIDKRVNDGKKVLIHCQLGVSRSASLIVAYGIYKNPRLTPDEAREQAKRQSRYIDLNMHFMYELGDFKKLLAEKFPQDQISKRPAGHKALTRTMTDSVLSMSSGHGRDMMTPILDEGEEESIQGQFADATRVDSAQRGPLSAPNASKPEDPTTPQPGDVHKVELDTTAEEIRAGDKTPKAQDVPMKLTLPSVKSLPTEDAPKKVPSIPPPEIPIPRSARISDELKSPPPLHLALPPRPHIENTAKNTDSLPSPHLELPNTNGTIPRRILRPMPSLPAGFSSIRNHGGDQPAFPGLKLSIEALKSPTTAPGEDILSPRLQEFTATPFHRSVRSLAGDLAEPSSSAFVSTPRNLEEDPRSPPTKGEVVVLRNIDDIIN